MVQIFEITHCQPRTPNHEETRVNGGFEGGTHRQKSAAGTRRHHAKAPALKCHVITQLPSLYRKRPKLDRVTAVSPFSRQLLVTSIVDATADHSYSSQTHCDIHNLTR